MKTRFPYCYLTEASLRFAIGQALTDYYDAFLPCSWCGYEDHSAPKRQSAFIWYAV